MAYVPEGCKLAVIDPNGMVAKTIELGDYDLDQPQAKAVLIEGIQDALRLMQLPVTPGTVQVECRKCARTYRVVPHNNGCYSSDVDFCRECSSDEVTQKLLRPF